MGKIRKFIDDMPRTMLFWAGIVVGFVGAVLLAGILSGA